jgi:AraC-like DNA-binding protein
MLLFDSLTVEAADRYEAIRELLHGATHPASFGPIDDHVKDRLRFRAWGLGSEASMFSAEGPGMYLRRRERANRFLADDSLVCLSVQPSGHAWVSHGGHDYDLRPGSLWLLNMCDEYDYVWDGWGSSSSYQVALDVLGLAPTDLAAAAPRLTASPLYPLVRDHLVGLAAYVKAGGPVTAALNYTMSDLFRALVISVLGDTPPPARPDDDVVLWEALSTFLRWHLRDPSLDERMISEALGIGEHRLRSLTQARGVSVMDFVVTRRLAGARQELEATRAADKSLAATARRWGFTSPAQLIAMLAGAPDADQAQPYTCGNPGPRRSPGRRGPSAARRSAR